jgi:hypothetical protein
MNEAMKSCGTQPWMAGADGDAGQDVGPDLADDLAHAGKPTFDALGQRQPSLPAAA